MTEKLTILALVLVTSAILACGGGCIGYSSNAKDYALERPEGAVCSTSLPLVADCGNLCNREFWPAALYMEDANIENIIRDELACKDSGVEFMVGGLISPLSIPVAHLHSPGLVELLLANGADPNDEITFYGQDWPALSGTIAFVNLYAAPGLAQDFLEDRRRKSSEDGRSVPKWLKDLNANSFTEDSVEIVRLLLESGADPVFETEQIGPPLFVATSLRSPFTVRGDWGKQNQELIELLLQHGAGAAITEENSKDYIFALFFLEADAWVIEKLLNHGLDPLAGDGLWLHHAAASGRENHETYQTFIDAGMDPSILNEDGLTACEVLRQEPPSWVRGLTVKEKGRELDLSAVEKVLCGQ